MLKCWTLWMFPGLFDASIIKFREQPHHLNNFLHSLNSELQRLSVTFQEFQASTISETIIDS